MSDSIDALTIEFILRTNLTYQTKITLDVTVFTITSLSFIPYDFSSYKNVSDRFNSGISDDYHNKGSHCFKYTCLTILKITIL